MLLMKLFAESVVPLWYKGLNSPRCSSQMHSEYISTGPLCKLEWLLVVECEAARD